MKKAFIGKAMPFILPLAIWIAITHNMILALYVIPKLSPALDGSDWVFMAGASGVINGIIQIALVSVLTVIAAKEFDFGMKKLVFSLPIMYVLFTVYHIPSLYIFVYTAEWSFMFTKHSAMNRFLAAFLITLQYGIVMLFTMMEIYSNKKSNIAGE